MKYIEFENKTARFVTHTLKSPSIANRPFHNFQRSRQIVSRVKEIADFYEIFDEEKCILAVAAWFMNAGHFIGPPGNWCEHSAVILANYLKTIHAPSVLIDSAQACIRAAGSTPQINSLVEKISYDAYTYYFGQADFKAQYALLEQEIGQHVCGFGQMMLATLQNHLYFTEYCQLLLNKEKDNNIIWLKTKLDANVGT